jgi:hypothetical protein
MALGVDEVNGVGRDAGDVRGARPLSERTVAAAGDELGMDGERAAECYEQGAIFREEREPRAVLAHGARDGERGIEVALGDDAAEGSVPFPPAGEEDGTRRAARVARAAVRAGGLHDLRPGDRLEPGFIADLPVEDEAVERVRVGERESIHAALARREREGLERVDPAHHRVVAMNVEMGERGHGPSTPPESPRRCRGARGA